MELRERLEKFKQKQKGFTLVELIVVIAIIGILAGVMLPKYFGFTDDARKAAVATEAKSIRSIAETYYANNGAWPTVTIVASPASFTIQGNTTPVFLGVISTYSASAAGTALASGEKISLTTADGSFNYAKTGNTGIASCDASGNVIVH